MNHAILDLNNSNLNNIVLNMASLLRQNYLEGTDTDELGLLKVERETLEDKWPAPSSYYCAHHTLHPCWRLGYFTKFSYPKGNHLPPLILYGSPILTGMKGCLSQLGKPDWSHWDYIVDKNVPIIKFGDFLYHQTPQEIEFPYYIDLVNGRNGSMFQRCLPGDSNWNLFTLINGSMDIIKIQFPGDPSDIMVNVNGRDYSLNDLYLNFNIYQHIDGGAFLSYPGMRGQPIIVHCKHDMLTRVLDLEGYLRPLYISPECSISSLEQEVFKKIWYRETDLHLQLLTEIKKPPPNSQQPVLIRRHDYAVWQLSFGKWDTVLVNSTKPLMPSCNSYLETDYNNFQVYKGLIQISLKPGKSMLLTIMYGNFVLKHWVYAEISNDRGTSCIGLQIRVENWLKRCVEPFDKVTYTPNNPWTMWHQFKIIFEGNVMDESIEDVHEWLTNLKYNPTTDTLHVVDLYASFPIAFVHPSIFKCL